MRARGGRKNGSAGTRLPVAKMKACVRAAHTTGTAEDARRWTLLARLLNAWLEEAASTARATLAASERSDAAIEPGARLRFDEVWANFTSPLVTDGIVGRRRHGRGAHAADATLTPAPPEEEDDDNDAVPIAMDGADEPLAGLS